MNEAHCPPRGVAVSFRSIAVRRGKRQVLHDVSFDVAPGEWLMVIGPNGAGKSTLLASAAGVAAHSGHIEIGGEAPNARTVALVPQNPVLPEGMTVAEYVLLGRTAHLGWLGVESAEDRAIAGDVLGQLDLDGFSDRSVTTLSGGETQRVVLARALAQDTPVLLLDEPTSALDVGHQVALTQRIEELRSRRPVTIVSAVHDLSLAGRVAERVVLLADGRVAAHGAPREVLRADLLSEVYRTPLVVREVEGELVVLPN